METNIPLDEHLESPEAPMASPDYSFSDESAFNVNTRVEATEATEETLKPQQNSTQDPSKICSQSSNSVPNGEDTENGQNLSKNPQITAHFHSSSYPAFHSVQTEYQNITQHHIEPFYRYRVYSDAS